MHRMNNILICCIILHYFTISSLGDSCVDPQTKAVIENFVEVYHVNSDDCESISRFSMEAEACESYYVLVAKKDPLLQYFIAESLLSTDSIFVMQLIEEEELCGKKMWRTNRRDLVVAVGEENFIGETEVSGPDFDCFSSIYVKEKADAYFSIRVSCEFNSQLKSYEKIEGRLESYARDMENLWYELSMYKEENAKLQEALSSVQLQLESDESTTKAGVINDINCQNFLLFPLENVVCVATALLYIIFSVINTITNYFSLRMISVGRGECPVFYTLTQGLTTRYVCRRLKVTKRKIDKWLIDIE